MPSPNPDEYWFEIPPPGGVAPPPERPDPPVDMAYYGAALPPVDVGVWGTWGCVAPPRVPGLEHVEHIVQVHVQVVRGAGEQAGEIALEIAKFGVLNLTKLGGYGTYKLGRALWNGYKEDGAVGAANALNPIYHFLKNGIDSYEAAARGDYRAAGRSGVTSLLAAVTTVLGAAGAAEALASSGGLGAAGARGATKGGATALPEGSFSIVDWSGYPAGAPRPSGPFRPINGAEHDAARRAANSTNQALHAADPSLKGLQIHEITPVKFGGSPTDLSNKIAVTQAEHAPLTTFWNRFRIYMEGMAGQ